MKNIIVYEITVKIFLLKTFNYTNASEILSSFVDKSFLADEKLKMYHQQNLFKDYSMDLLYKWEEDGIYKEDNIYTFRVRTVDRELKDYFLKQLPNTSTEYIKGLTAKVKVIPKKHIEKIFSITPIVMKLQEGGYWKNNISYEKFLELLKINAIKKYNNYTKEKIDEDFDLFNSVEKLNKVPIGINYKSIKLLGDKLDLEIANNSLAQDIAYLLVGVGLGNNGARACGFMGYKYE